MRAWLDPNRMAVRDLSASDRVYEGLARTKRAGGVCGFGSDAHQCHKGQAFQYTLSTLGRLVDPQQFGNIVVKTGSDGRLTRLRDLVSDVRPKVKKAK